jgi:glutamate dehydrogenase (NAD(P)+)
MSNETGRGRRALEAAIRLSDLPDRLLHRVRIPDAVIKYSIPLERDDGNMEWIDGWRVQHSNARGVYKGGLRYHPAVDEHEVRSLAFLMSLKTAVCRAPAGGAKGGLRVDPKQLSETELERLSRAFGRRLAVHVGPQRDVPAGDVGTPPKVMRWLLEGGELPRAAITSKPVADGGDPFRDAATGYGTALCARRYLETRDQPVDGRTVSIQGFGNVGSWCALTMAQWGARVVGVSNSKLSIRNDAGFSVDTLRTLADRMPRRFEDAERYGRVESPEAILHQPVDILAPCAIGGAIHKDNAASVEAKVVVEGANGPVTEDADDTLERRGIPVLPGVLANGGGVCCSMYEWEANLQDRQPAEGESEPRLKAQLTDAFQGVHAVRQDLKVPYRVAAYVVAVRTLAEASS